MKNTVNILGIDVVVKHVQMVGNEYIVSYDNSTIFGMPLMISGQWIRIEDTIVEDNFSSRTSYLNKVKEVSNKFNNAKKTLLIKLNK